MINKTEEAVIKVSFRLDKKQAQFIKDNFSKIKLLELTRQVFKNRDLGTSDEEYSRVRGYVSSLKRKTKYIELTESQMDTIVSKSGVMSPIEFARNFFPDKEIKPLSMEVKTITMFIKANELEDKQTEFDPSSYSPPKADSKIVSKINQADLNAEFVLEDLSSYQKKCVEVLRGHLGYKRFVMTINSIRDAGKKEYFENLYVSSIYDKPDLNMEELNMYISLCEDYLLVFELREQIDGLNGRLERAIQDTEGDSRDMTVALSKALSDKIRERDDCLKRMKATQESLSKKRSDRVEQNVKLNESLTKFVEMWAEQEDRQKLLLMAEARNLLLKEAKDAIEDFPEWIAKVQGVSENEILNT